MTFEETRIPGVFIVDLAPIRDERGFFARVFAAEEFEARGLNPDVAQSSLSFNAARGTLRGMHFQRAPAAEAKLVRCIRGTIFDVAVDLRPDSPGYLTWVSCELSADNRRAVYIPEGCAHGFQTLANNCDVLYQVSHGYTPELSGGVRYDDPAIGIRWPLPVSVISVRDSSWPAIVPSGEVHR